MQNLKISQRLALIVAAAALVMLTLAGITWQSLNHLAELQDAGVVKSAAAG